MAASNDYDFTSIVIRVPNRIRVIEAARGTCTLFDIVSEKTFRIDRAVDGWQLCVKASEDQSFRFVMRTDSIQRLMTILGIKI